MDDQPEIYFQFDYRPQQRASLESAQPQGLQPSQKSDDSISMSPDEPIDECLLSKTSQLHESLRNQKLLQFQMLQAEIMKSQVFTKSRAIEEDLIKMEHLKKKLEKENRDDSWQLSRLEEEVKIQKTQNQELLKRLGDTRRKVAKTRQEKERVQKESPLFLAGKDNKNIKQHGYVSIEAIRLEAQNQSKKELIHQLKAVINEVKVNLTRKKDINRELEEEYQLILKQIQQEEKRKRCSQQNSKAKSQVEVFFKDQTQKSSISYAQADKENDMNHENICSTRSVLKSNGKQPSVKLNSEATVNKGRGSSTNCLKNWFETGRKHLSKKIY